MHDNCLIVDEHGHIHWFSHSYLICRISSCPISSSFRDSSYTDQDFGGPCGDDGSDSNGIEHVFEGKTKILCSIFFQQM